MQVLNMQKANLLLERRKLLLEMRKLKQKKESKWTQTDNEESVTVDQFSDQSGFIYRFLR